MRGFVQKYDIFRIKFAQIRTIANLSLGNFVFEYTELLQINP